MFFSVKLLKKSKIKNEKRKIKRERKNVIEGLKNGYSGFDIQYKENINFFREKGFFVGEAIDSYYNCLWLTRIYCDEDEISEKERIFYDFGEGKEEK